MGSRSYGGVCGPSGPLQRQASGAIARIGAFPRYSGASMGRSLALRVEAAFFSVASDTGRQFPEKLQGMPTGTCSHEVILLEPTKTQCRSRNGDGTQYGLAWFRGLQGFPVARALCHPLQLRRNEEMYPC